MDFTQFMEHVVTVSAGDGSTRDSGGGTVQTWTTRATGIACLVNASGGNERDQFGQQQIPNTLRIASYYTGVQRGDRLTVTAGPSQVGKTFRVVGLQSQPGLDVLGIGTLYYWTVETLE